MSDREIVRQLVVRILVVIALVLGALCCLFGFARAFEVYRGDVFVGLRSVADHWNWFFGAIVMLLLPGMLVWRTPRLGSALLWSMWTVFVATLLFLGTYDLAESGLRVVELWPLRAFRFAMFGLLVHLVAIVPFTCAIAWFVTRERTQRPVLPIARVVR